ncbi:MAG: hypothetical protein NT045_05275, partial [Candidatus Aureabacteria bacterium]|nr:hypothetical protein [Candidatus Auribacterota bacterium]
MKVGIFCLVALVVCPVMLCAQGGMTVLKNGIPVDSGNAAPVTSSQLKAAEQVKSMSSEPLAVKYNQATGVPYLVTGKISLGVKATKNGAAEATAVRKFLNANKELFRMKDANSELNTRSNDTDRFGLRTIRFTQRHNGIPVYGGDLVAGFDKGGLLTSVNGNYLPGIDVDMTPTVSGGAAVGIARGALGIAADNIHNTIGPELMIYPQNGVYHLAWCLTLVTRKPFAEWKCFVDAKAGTLIDKWNDAKFVDAMLTG